MTDINQIQLFVQTGSSSISSGERVFLGFNGRHGREFRCRLEGGNTNPFESDSETHLIFGQDSNVSESNLNDPRNPQMDDLMLGRAYLRLDTTSQTEWIIREVRININGNDTHNLLLNGITLNRDSSETIYID